MLGKGYRSGNGNFQNMIFLSLTLHVVVVALILVSVPTTSRHLTFGAAYSVQLVGSEAVMPSQETSSLSDILESKKTSDAIIIKRKISSIYSSPLKTPATQKLDVEKAVGALRQKERAGKNKGECPASGRTAMTDAEVNAQANEYIETVWSRVKAELVHTAIPAAG